MTKTKNKHYFSLHRILALLALGVLIVLSTHRLFAQTVTQGYNSDDFLQRGMIVTLKKNDPTRVEAVTLDSIDRMQGVVVDPNDSPVTISSDNQRVFVASTGQFAVLVSNQNGTIAAGDYLSASSLNGIGMKATASESLIVGKALASFDGKSSVLSSTTVKDKSGHTQTVAIGQINVDIGIVHNPLSHPTTDVPDFLHRVSSSVANKPVSTARVSMTLVILVAIVIISGTTLYTGIRSSITAIGRNPLSRQSILRSLLQVIITSLVIFAIGLGGVYLLLKL